MLTKFRDHTQWRCFRGLSAGVGITLSIKHQNVNVFGEAQDVIKTTETNIVGPSVATDQPDRFFNQRVSIGQQLFSPFNTLKRVAQFSNLCATNVRRGLRMQGVIQLCRDFIGKLFQQTHYAGAVLIDRQAESQTKFCVILK